MGIKTEYNMKPIFKIIIGMIGLGALAATAIATGAIPNPFEANTPIPSHLQHEMKVLWNHDGKHQNTPTIEQIVPFDDHKYFSIPSSTVPNPTEKLGVFTFDFEIEQAFFYKETTGTLFYKVNSNDNSMYFAGVDFEKLHLYNVIKNQINKKKYALDFVIRNAKGDWLLFVTYKNQQKKCIQFTSGFSFSQQITDINFKNIEFLESTKKYHSTVVNEAVLEPYEGKFKDSKGNLVPMTFWFAKTEAKVATSVPLMGLGVGIFKNPLEQKQQFLAITERKEITFKLIHLENIEPWKIQTKEYEKISFDYHLLKGQNTVNSEISEFKRKQNELYELRLAYKKCSSGKMGRDCRIKIEKQIKQIQLELSKRAIELKESLLPPLEK